MGYWIGYPTDSQVPDLILTLWNRDLVSQEAAKEDSEDERRRYG